MMRRISILALPLLLAACASIQYREVQRDFNSAVAADNDGSVLGAAAGFEVVVSTLTPEYIAGLDPRLRMNAWTIRSFAQWRAGDLDGADTSAEKGSVLLGTSASRDAILLEMLPGLAEETRAMRAWRSAEGDPTPEVYKEEIEGKFSAALGSLSLAAARVGNETPQSTVDYLHFHRWRMLVNWEYVIFTVGDNRYDPAAETLRATSHLGATFEAAIKGERDGISKGSPLRALMVE